MNIRLPRFVAALVSSAALLTVAVPAHVVGKNALGLTDNQEAKDAVIAAIEAALK